MAASGCNVYDLKPHASVFVIPNDWKENAAVGMFQRQKHGHVLIKAPGSVKRDTWLKHGLAFQAHGITSTNKLYFVRTGESLVEGICHVSAMQITKQMCSFYRDRGVVVSSVATMDEMNVHLHPDELTVIGEEGDNFFDDRLSPSFCNLIARSPKLVLRDLCGANKVLAQTTTALTNLSVNGGNIKRLPECEACFFKLRELSLTKGVVVDWHILQAMLQWCSGTLITLNLDTRTEAGTDVISMHALRHMNAPMRVVLLLLAPHLCSLRITDYAGNDPNFQELKQRTTSRVQELALYYSRPQPFEIPYFGDTFNNLSSLSIFCAPCGAYCDFHCVQDPLPEPVDKPFSFSERLSDSEDDDDSDIEFEIHINDQCQFHGKDVNLQDLPKQMLAQTCTVYFHPGSIREDTKSELVAQIKAIFSTIKVVDMDNECPPWKKQRQ